MKLSNMCNIKQVIFMHFLTADHFEVLQGEMKKEGTATVSH